MKISTRTYYGIQSLTYLGTQGHQCTLANIVEHEHIPEVYLEKILQMLRKAGIIISKQGARGGYALAKEPKDITLADIFSVLEGPTITAPCLNDQACAHKERCATRPFWHSLEETISQQLNTITLDDIIHKQ